MALETHKTAFARSKAFLFRRQQCQVLGAKRCRPDIDFLWIYVTTREEFVTFGTPAIIDNAKKR